MQAVVKTPRTNLEINGDIHPKIINLLTTLYGDDLKIINEDDEYVNIKDSEWYKNMKEKMTPGKYMRVYRNNKNWTQKELGEKLGGITVQNISHYENSVRPISHKLAYKLSKLFNAPVEEFL